MRLPAGRRAWERWLAAAGPWRGWSVCPTLLSPELERIDPRPPRSAPQAAHLAACIAPVLETPGTLCLLDLEPTLGVQVAARLVRYAHPVLLLPRWPYAEALLPANELAWTVVHESRRLPRRPEGLPNVVFVLDAERARPLRNRLAHDPRADNRYQLAVFELPDLRTLRVRGITRIRRIQHG
jgi:hypothetical protein